MSRPLRPHEPVVAVKVREHWRERAAGRLRAALLVASLCLLALTAARALAADPALENDGAQVLQSFAKAPAVAVTSDAAEQTRRWVMFALGAPLLVLLLITGGLGVAMGVYGKPVFVAHMVFAGLSITLAIVHAIVGIVWFRPF